MKIKVGDNVKVIAGKDKGKTGTVIKTLKNVDKVIVDGINIVKKHQKPTNNNSQGGIIEMSAPIHVSNVKLTDEKTTKKTSKKEDKPKKEAKKEQVGE